MGWIASIFLYIYILHTLAPSSMCGEAVLYTVLLDSLVQSHLFGFGVYTISGGGLKE